MRPRIHIKTHVGSFQQILTHGGSEDALTCDVVGVGRCACLGLDMARFGEGYLYRACPLACRVDDSRFGFSGGGHDVLDNVAHDVNR